MLSKAGCLLLATVLALAAPHRTEGRTPQLRYGLEWGGSTTLVSTHHYNYLDNTLGFRIDDSGTDTHRWGNAFVCAYCGLDLLPRLALSLRSGLAGIAPDRRLVPLTLRLSWHPHGSCSDGLFLLGEGGPGFPDFLEDRPMVLAIAGGGYRLQLGEKSSLDLLLTARAVLDHPAIWDEEERHYIETQNVRRNDAVHYALCLSLGLNF